MSESAKSIIKYFCDRFFVLDYYPSSLKEVLDLQLNKLKNIDNDEVKKFESYNIVTLRDLTKLDNQKYKTLVKKGKINKLTLKNALIASNLISNAWNKRNIYLKKPQLKVVVAGLDFAGKTSLINRLINDHNYNDIINLEPTIGANVEEYESERLDLVLWDLGGQKDHINEYLDFPERFFIQTDVLIYVFDSQDDIRYTEAINYLNDIVNIFSFLDEKPYIVILLNKVDDDLRNDPDFQIKVEYLTEKISEIFKNTEKSWTFEIIPTSIYNYYSNEPEIVKNIKNIFSQGKVEKDKEIVIPDIEEKFQKILDINLKIMDNFVSELSEIKRILHRLNPSSMSQSLFSIPFKKVKTEHIPLTSNLNERGKKKKKVKVDEPQKKKKYKKGSGPPKPLSKDQFKQLNEQITAKDDRLTSEKINKVKTSLKLNSQIDQESSIPPSAPKLPKDNVINIDALKPPPPPPPTSSHFTNKSLPRRSEIVSELKEMFVKRGLVTQYDL